ncbi:hypothetical protein A8924_0666 [Saccharopolyspora erythraea NRRL 2338]|uniref:Uncharacterized protein n=2 Tax=Saccharopolyspora erythraea TaxID=1836 RepID=A4F6E6_SACEN|nr:hypothetical protein [Saccharopolyspora erythraea]EQD88080.1 hypothetical protein N599_01320 [Saccharopolyspora erythraea D]PFG93425.1 hypothetical protein A8924_0666 [Saccharopolyspora erythraea NRRL 2338]QRK90298.1 hypothetical protein JQX30_01840 [Saccharopolyspora erythraea]CAL99620.1 hypothetical protein SACE_0270 [Saccharopolyspora erythraea NRRL 2338]
MGFIDTDLSFDPKDPYFPAPGTYGVEWGVQVFTEDNGYAIHAGCAYVHETDRVTVHSDRFALFGQQTTVDAGVVDAEVVNRDGVLEWSIKVRHTEAVKAVKLMLRGLPPEQLRAGWWTPNTGRGWAHGVNGHRIQLEYPGPDMATAWLAVGDEAECSTLSIRDPRVRRQIVHVRHPQYSPLPIVEVVHVTSADDRSQTYRVPPVRLRVRASSAVADQDLDDHLAFAEKAHGLRPWETRPDVPDWMRRVALVVTLHGQHWTGYVFNTFPQMEEALRFVTQHIEGHRVLAYLPGWEGRYYYAYPQYRPGPDLGGDEGFAALAGTARELGVRLMPMFGGHGANVKQYPKWEDAVLRNDTNRYVELLNRPDWDTDRVGEGNQVFLNPGEPGFRAHLVESISAMVREFGVDAAFLDTLGYWFNDPRYDVMDGCRLLRAELLQRHPDLLLAVEGWWDALSALFPLGQHWFGTDRDIRKPRVLTRYARTTGHLAEGTPGPGSTGVHEKGFVPRPPDTSREGHIPVLGIVDDTLPTHAEEVAAICRWARDNGPR